MATVWPIGHSMRLRLSILMEVVARHVAQAARAQASDANDRDSLTLADLAAVDGGPQPRP